MKIRAAIIGASGYSGEELVRLLLRHPRVQIACVTSRQNSGKKLADVFPKFASHPVAQRLKFVEPRLERVLKTLGANPRSAVVFLALPHGVASEWASPLWNLGVRVIDLSADFRLNSAAAYKEFYGQDHPAPRLVGRAVYGLPELYRAKIKRSRFIASPGCYPTSILVPLIPLLRAKLIQPGGIVANSLSGVSGAGRTVQENLLFCECNESVRAYGIPKHRHVPEIEQELSLAAGRRVLIQFNPHLIPVNRGILTTVCVQPSTKSGNLPAAIARCYERAYGGEPFIRLLTGTAMPDTKNVAGTNVIEIAHRVDPRTGGIILLSAEDNLTKGASGQAVQSMNILFGFPETSGLL